MPGYDWNIDDAAERAKWSDRDYRPSGDYNEPDFFGRRAAWSYSTGEPGYLARLRQSALSRLRGPIQPPIGGGMENRYNETMQRAPGAPGTGNDLTYLRGAASSMDRDATSDAQWRAAGDTLEGQNWRMRQKALMEGLYRREAQRTMNSWEERNKQLRQGGGWLAKMAGMMFGGAGGSMAGNEIDAQLQRRRTSPDPEESY